VKRMYSLVRKHTLNIRGRKTSISLESEFWDALQEIADEKRLSVTELVRQIDAERKNVNLSSAIRVYVFRHYHAAVQRQERAKLRD